MVSIGTLGDVNPFISLGQALQRRGHRITFLAPAVHEELVREAGFAFHALGSREDYFALINNPDLWDSRKAFETLWRGVLSILVKIPTFVRALPADEQCLLLTHPFALPAASLARAERPDLPIVGGYLAPANMRTLHDPLTIGPIGIPAWLPMSWRRWIWNSIDAKLIDRIAVPDLNKERQRNGLEPVAHLVEHMHTVADLSLTLFPSWFAKDQPDWPQPRHSGEFPLFDPHPEHELSDEIRHFLANGDAPIIFTSGTGHKHGSAYFSRALDAVTRLGRRAIFLTPFQKQLPTALPGEVLWQSYVPLRRLLVHAAAIVHHGGIGTTAEALRSGIPQVVVPFAHDQFDNGARVEALGVGHSIKAASASGRVLESTLASLLSSDSVNARCKAAAMRLAKASDTVPICEAIEGVLLARSKKADLI
ncbi:rhamnosyltransferase subunit B [Variovorax sp. GrIS 2.14]|uniref:glycosyltransferase n=1 Tax=Variovorax sp. GrIS 2.14 TaxID=3071709 RepID=UPI0038F7B3DF